MLQIHIDVIAYIFYYIVSYRIDLLISNDIPVMYSIGTIGFNSVFPTEG
jgi:hypothetical protein